MKCNCEDWEPQLEILNGPLFLQQVRSGTTGIPYAGKVFVFCPWCGSALIDEASKEGFNE